MSNKKIIAFGLIAGGLALAYRASQKNAPAAPVNGLGFSLHKAISQATSSVQKAVSPIVSKVPAPILAVATGGGSLVSKQVVNQVNKVNASVASNKAILTFRSGKQTGNAPTGVAPGQAVVYQDAQGNTITQGVYDQIMQVVNRVVPPMYGPNASGLYQDGAGQQYTNAEYTLWLRAGGGTAQPLSSQAMPVTDTNYPQGNPAPAAASPPVSYTQPPADSGGGGGTSYADAASAFGPDTSTAPAPAAADASAQQQYAPAPADSVAPPSKLNPFVVVGAALLGGAVLMLNNKHH